MRPSTLRHVPRDHPIPWQVWGPEPPLDDVDRGIGLKETYLSGHKTASDARTWALLHGYRLA